MSTEPITESTTLPATSSQTTTTTPSVTDQTPRTLRISTRSSALALAQTQLFTTLLSTHPDPSIAATTTSIHPIHTSLGDTNKTTALHTLASTTGKSLWTEDLEHDLLHDKVDIIVHSLKDVPTKLPTGLVCSAIGRREESRDCVVLSKRWAAEQLRLQEQHDITTTSTSTPTSPPSSISTSTSGLDILPAGSIIGTSSIRRQAMIRRAFPSLEIRDLRGNVPTRIKKIDEDREGEGGGVGGYDAAVLAGAGVQRLGLEGRISGWLDASTASSTSPSSSSPLGTTSTSTTSTTPTTAASDSTSVFLHAVGQGAIGVEWRSIDTWVAGIVLALLHSGKRERRVGWEGLAERELLRVLEGGCSVPVGVDCVWDDEEEGKGEGEGEEGREEGEEEEGLRFGGYLIMKAIVISVDGSQCVHASRRHWIGSDTQAEECGWQVARELVERGAGEILKEIELNRDMIARQDGA